MRRKREWDRGETEREKHRHTDRQTERETHRERNTHREERERQRDRQTKREGVIETEPEKILNNMTIIFCFSNNFIALDSITIPN